jgi:hypothetical protein
MVICPQCGYPYENDQLMVGVRDITCANCPWHGSSSDLITVSDEAPVDKMQELYRYLGAEIAPVLGKKMVALGLLEETATTSNITKVARVLKSGTRGAFTGVISSLFAEE